MVALGLCCCEQAASSGVWWGYALVAARRLLTVVASLVVEPRQVGFRGGGSQDCFVACVIFPDQGLNLCPLHGQAGC